MSALEDGRSGTSTPFGGWNNSPGAQVQVEPRFRSGVKSAKGRARPDEPLAEWCQARFVGLCTGRAECRHHLLRRGRGGSDDASNTRDLCNRCHDEGIHKRVGWAYEHGWLIRGAA